MHRMGSEKQGNWPSGHVIINYMNVEDWHIQFLYFLFRSFCNLLGVQFHAYNLKF